MTIQRPFSSGSRSAPDPYDNYLEKNGFYRKHTARDSSSLFRVISEQMYDTQNHHVSVREQCVKYMRKNRSWFNEKVLEDLDDYLDEMSKPKTNGTLLELQAIAYMYQRNIILFHPMELGSYWIYENFEMTFHIFVSSDSHFDTVYTANYIKDAGFCQSICYEILYKDVFKLPDITYAVEQMLYGTSFDNVKIKEEKDGLYCRRINLDDGREFEFDMPDSTNCILENKSLCHFHNPNFLKFVENIKNTESADNGNNNKIEKIDIASPPRKISDSLLTEKYISCVRQLLSEGITPFPYKVAKALDPDMYRNIEFDSWSEIRKEHRYQTWYSGGTNLQVGVKCQVYLHKTNEYLTGYIQEINGNDSNSAINENNCNGPCVVFIEQLGEKRVVPYDCLKPLPSDQVKPWGLPYRLQQKFSKQYLASTKSLKVNQDYVGNLNYRMIEYYGYDNFTPINQTYNIMPVNRTTIARNQLTKDSNRKREKNNEDSTQYLSDQNYSNVDSSKNTEQQKSISNIENIQYPEQNSVETQSINITTYDQCGSYSFGDTYDYNYSARETVIHAPIPGPHYYIYSPGYQQPVFMQPSGRYYQTASLPGTNTPAVARVGNGSINYSSRKSVLENGDDLPMDISTLRFFYNMGVDHYNDMKSKGNNEFNCIVDDSNKLAIEMEKVDIESDPNQNGTHIKQNKNNNSSNSYNNCTQQQQMKYRYQSRYYNNRKGQNNYRGGNNSGNYPRNYTNHNNSKNYLRMDTRNNRNNNTDGQRIQITANSPTSENNDVQICNSDSQANTTVSSTGYSPSSYDEQIVNNIPTGHSNPTSNGNLFMSQVIPIPFGPTTLGPPPPLPSSQHPNNGYQYIPTPISGITPHYVQAGGVPNQYYMPSATSGNEILGLVPDGIPSGAPVTADHGQYPPVNYSCYYSPNNQGYWYAPPTGSQCMTPNTNTK